MVEVVDVCGFERQAWRLPLVDCFVRVDPRLRMMEVARRKKNLEVSRMEGSLGARVVDGVLSPGIGIQGVV